MNITLGGLALLCFVGLILFSSGCRLRVFTGALLGSVIGGVLILIGTALLKGLSSLGSALLGAFT